MIQISDFIINQRQRDNIFILKTCLVSLNKVKANSKENLGDS